MNKFVFIKSEGITVNLTLILLIFYCILCVFVCVFFFFFKQKTAYEISACLVGSEMCIRDRTTRVSNLQLGA